MSIGSWFRTRWRRLWQRGAVEPRERLTPVSGAAVQPEEESLWAIYLQRDGGRSYLVAMQACTRDVAQEIGVFSAAGGIFHGEHDVFIGRSWVQEVPLGSEDLLKTALAAAVPLWINQLKDRPWSLLQARAAEASQIVASMGDVILYRGKKKGETARAFNALAEGIAICAFAPGGVTAFGMHFEAKHEGGI